jgi:hypothetical protein
LIRRGGVKRQRVDNVAHAPLAFPFGQRRHEESPVPEGRCVAEHSISTASTAGATARFALASLATWRVTHLIAEEDGPADIVVRARRRAGESWTGELMDCFYCLSVWVAAPFAFVVSRRPREAPLVWLALSGAACLLEQATKEPRPAGDEEGEDDGLLR